MNHPKPGILAKFREGVFISTIVGVVKTLNWVVSCLDNLAVGRGLKLTGVKEGKPAISSAISFGDGLKATESSDGSISVSLDAEVGGGVKVVGTDGTYVDGVTSLTFASGDDSNVNVSVTKGSTDGSAVVKIDVYYK